MDKKGKVKPPKPLVLITKDKSNSAKEANLCEPKVPRKVSWAKLPGEVTPPNIPTSSMYHDKMPTGESSSGQSSSFQILLSPSTSPSVSSGQYSKDRPVEKLTSKSSSPFDISSTSNKYEILVSSPDLYSTDSPARKTTDRSQFQDFKTEKDSGIFDENGQNGHIHITFKKSPMMQKLSRTTRTSPVPKSVPSPVPSPQHVSNLSPNLSPDRLPCKLEKPILTVQTLPGQLSLSKLSQKLENPIQTLEQKSSLNIVPLKDGKISEDIKLEQSMQTKSQTQPFSSEQASWKKKTYKLEKPQPASWPLPQTIYGEIPRHLVMSPVPSLAPLPLQPPPEKHFLKLERPMQIQPLPLPLQPSSDRLYNKQERYLHTPEQLSPVPQQLTKDRLPPKPEKSKQISSPSPVGESTSHLDVNVLLIRCGS